MYSICHVTYNNHHITISIIIIIAYNQSLIIRKTQNRFFHIRKLLFFFLCILNIFFRLQSLNLDIAGWNCNWIVQKIKSCSINTEGNKKKIRFSDYVMVKYIQKFYFSFCRYFYTGQIKISHQTVLPVLSLADKYNVKVSNAELLKLSHYNFMEFIVAQNTSFVR